MRGKLFYSHNDVKKNPNNGADTGANFAETGACRLRKIEELLGVFIAADCIENLNHGEYDLMNRHDQTIQLINAFELITDPKCRADIIEIVIAAAQRERQLD